MGLFGLWCDILLHLFSPCRLNAPQRINILFTHDWFFRHTIAILFQSVDLFPVVLLYTILVAVSTNLVWFFLSLSQSCHLPNCHWYIHYSNRSMISLSVGFVWSRTIKMEVICSIVFINVGRWFNNCMFFSIDTKGENTFLDNKTSEFKYFSWNNNGWIKNAHCVRRQIMISLKKSVFIKNCEN